MNFWKLQGRISPMSKIRDSHLEGFAISRPSVASIYNYIYRCIFEFWQTRKVSWPFGQKSPAVTSQNQTYLEIVHHICEYFHRPCQVVVWEVLPSFTSMQLSVFGLSRIFWKGRRKLTQSNELITLLLPPNRLKPSFFAIFFKRLDKNPQNFRSEHLRTCPQLSLSRYFVVTQIFQALPIDS